ncbi:MAG: PDZ domain-containing protein [Planctomycetes bacterium]|nr:PDZ domain-containing protein [Planctomycetota bacterium]
MNRLILAGVVWFVPSSCLMPRGAVPAADVRPHAGMLRYPDVSATEIVFEYANDLWLVPRDGGVAAPLSSPRGQELLPRFSPDGATIAFVGNYDGNRDLYLIPVAGGVPTRVTHHPDDEVLCDWTPDGQLLFYTNAFAGIRAQSRLFTVSPKGGLPVPLPFPIGANGAISADGRRVAFTPHSADDETWKRYCGGLATDVWLFDLVDHTSKRLTDWEGTDTLPMWHGDDVYYLSDQGPEHRLNVWMCDTKRSARRQVTTFRDYDVKWPSMGPGSSGRGEIVFQCGASLWLLDLASEKSHAVDVAIPGDRPTLRLHSVDASRFVARWSLSPTGKRAVCEARGDVWTAPAKKGAPRNLTHTSGVAERDATWSPDGHWIAYVSDATGEYELWITPSDGDGEARKLTSGSTCFRFGPSWSPDSKRIAFRDKTGAYWIHTIDGGETKTFDVDPRFTYRESSPGVAWSSDSRWIAYDRGSARNVNSTIWLYDTKSGETHEVTSGMFDDSSPVFDRTGDWLFFVSKRSFTPTYGELDKSFVYAGTQVILGAPLRADVKSPWAPKIDEETFGEKKDDKTAEKKSDKPAEVRIDLDGFEHRAILLPVKNGRFAKLAVNDKGQLIYARVPVRGSSDSPVVQLFDLGDEKNEEKTVAANAANFEISADGKKVLVVRDKTASMQDAAAGSTAENIVTADMAVTIDPREEWRQIFTDAWRIERDFFYDPGMHGVDWGSVRKQYAAMLEDCASREDVSFVIGEMIAELNVGHAYVWSVGDVEEGAKVAVGMLGVDFTLTDGAYRIAKIYDGADWDADARSPLRQPGVDVNEGDFVLAVNGVPVDVSKDPWAAFQETAGRATSLTVSRKSTLDAEARDVVVEPLASESTLRYRAWIEANRKLVDAQTGGRAGYIYVPDTGFNGQNDLARQFYGQTGKDALIIDERWNGGGQIPSRFIELLNRPVLNYFARRDGLDWQWPPDSHQGPKCMLINQHSGSGGDAFPLYFRQNKLGKVIGTRTWGGFVGISGNPDFIDGGRITAPTFGYYRTNGTWGVEGHGIDPDIEVIADPAKMLDGSDPQLDAAIAEILDELRTHPFVAPKKPPYPNRSGMGIRDEDK